MTMLLIAYLVIGYLLGSLSPGYFFGRVVKGIDIRGFKNKNTGAAVMAILDQLSFLIDDNLLVPIGTTVILAALF